MLGGEESDGFENQMCSLNNHCLCLKLIIDNKTHDCTSDFCMLECVHLEILPVSVPSLFETNGFPSQHLSTLLFYKFVHYNRLFDATREN